MSVQTADDIAGNVGSPLVRSPLRNAGAATRRAWVKRRGVILRAVVLLAILLSVSSEAYLGTDVRDFVVRRSLAGAAFDFAGWEASALTEKAADAINRPGSALTEAQQTALVRDYFAAMQRARELGRQIKAVYSDPSVEDHMAAALPFEDELAAIRDEQAARRPAVESILENQVARTIEAAGLGTGIGTFPPIRFQFSESPNLLILSPRDHIALDQSYHVDPALPLARVGEIEDEVAQDLGMSTLIEETGGVATYPTMVVEEPSLEWVLSTIAHEWVHTYLFFRPLGRAYNDNGDMRTLNETTASIIGDEVARRAMLRYYPDLVPPEPWPRPLSSRLRWWELTPEDRPFEFGSFMRETRLEVDRLLADGKVEEAEAYMESRRQELVEQGYNIRKLNQAYFAFHGSYAVGTAATDPIGAKLRSLRERSADLADFVHTVSRINSVAELDAALAGNPPKLAPTDR